MPLTEYIKKRRFESTPEPKGTQKTKRTQELRFVIQKHAASHLHYDFRIELDGVLKSWAIPKGPSLDSRVKRLAMMTEDHPLDYLTFEGTIPKGNYGAGEVKVWDLGVYHHAQTLDAEKNRKNIKSGIIKGHIDFVLYGEKLKGRFSLIKLENDPGGKSWLLIKQKDEYATKKDILKRDDSVLSHFQPKTRSEKKRLDPMPHAVKPMLATLIDEPFDRDEWLFEVKWDGYRAIAEIDPKKQKLALYSRNGVSFLKKYPPITQALQKIKRQAVLDGEIVALKNGRSDFHALQNYDETRVPLQYALFDLLYLDGQDMREKPLIERKRLLKEIIPDDPTFLYSEHIEKNGKAFFREATRNQFEGMIAKDKMSPYREGSRTNEWLKIKKFHEQEAVICGFTEPRGTRKKFGALVLGAYENGTLRYIGHSGGGFTDRELREMHARLEKIRTKRSPFEEVVPINSPITWVKPRFVCQVKYSEWTPDGRMRHPIYTGLRTDKDPKEVIKESPSVTNKTSSKKLSSVPKITNLEKIFFPKEKYTKGDVIEYYEKISEIILPYLVDRPQSLHRHPNGINAPSFFQKDIKSKVPSFIETHKIWTESNEQEINCLLCQNKETLLYLANLGCIELNPWNSRIHNLDHPDYLILDLDPGKNTWEELIQVALVVHKVLEIACEEHYVKTSGKRGLHVLVPLGAQYDYQQIRSFAHLLAQVVHDKIPELTSIERNPKKRTHKIYIDYLQNRRGQTLAAPYSLRPWPGATVSTPLEWKEVNKKLDPGSFTLKTIWKRLEKKGDLWEPLLKNKIDLAESIRCLEKHFSKKFR